LRDGLVAVSEQTMAAELALRARQPRAELRREQRHANMNVIAAAVGRGQR
jgi:hypothetical protein